MTLRSHPVTSVTGPYNHYGYSIVRTGRLYFLLFYSAADGHAVHVTDGYGDACDLGQTFLEAQRRRQPVALDCGDPNCGVCPVAPDTLGAAHVRRTRLLPVSP